LKNDFQLVKSSALFFFDWGGSIKYHRISESVITMAAEIASSPFGRGGNVSFAFFLPADDERAKGGRIPNLV
jgi:hypothetical protein